MNQPSTEIRKINKLDQVNIDPLLSQFKYHFIIQKMPCPKQNEYQNFIYNLHKGMLCLIFRQVTYDIQLGFKSQFVLTNSIYIIQFYQKYPNNQLIDIFIGFRRDDIAIKVARQINHFQYNSRAYNLQISNAFGLFLDQLNSKYKKQRQQMMNQMGAPAKLSLQNIKIKSSQSPQKKVHYNGYNERERSRDKKQLSKYQKHDKYKHT